MTFLSRIVSSAKAFGELVLAKTGDDRIDHRLENLRMIKAAQGYGLFMYLRVSGVDVKHFTNILALTENFILRRPNAFAAGLGAKIVRLAECLPNRVEGFFR